MDHIEQVQGTDVPHVPMIFALIAMCLFTKPFTIAPGVKADQENNH